MSILNDFEYSEEASKKKAQDIQNYIFNYHDDSIILADGFELAFLGCGYSFNNSHAVYDMGICLEILMQRDGMTYDEAEEFFEYNVLGAFVSDRMPVFLVQMKDLAIEHFA